VAEAKREHAAVLRDPREVIEQARVLREQALAAMEALAANEDEIARLHEELAARRPERPDDRRFTRLIRHAGRMHVLRALPGCRSGPRLDRCGCAPGREASVRDGRTRQF